MGAVTMRTSRWIPWAAKNTRCRSQPDAPRRASRAFEFVAAAEVWVIAYGGTITVSASASTSGPCPGVTVRSETVRTGFPSAPAVTSS